MVALRRTRIFLVVAACAAFTVYYLFLSKHSGVIGSDHFSQPLPNNNALNKLKYNKTPPPVSPADRKAKSETPAIHEKLGLEVPKIPDVVSTPLGDVHDHDSLETDYDDTDTKPRKQEPLQEEDKKTLASENTVAKVDDTPPISTPETSDLLTLQSPSRWRKLKEKFPIGDAELIKLPTGQPKKLPKIQFEFKTEGTSEKAERLKKLGIIRQNFLHAWNGYKLHAMPHDEVKPISKKRRDPFLGCGATLVDSLDTLLIMGLDDEFEIALKEVAKIDFKMCTSGMIKLFETTIRYLGGLLSAYDLSNEKHKILIDKATLLAEILMGAFDTPNRMPMTFYHWNEPEVFFNNRAAPDVVMAELGSLAMEFTRLAQITGNDRYYDAIARITNALEAWQMETDIPGLWPLSLDASGCKPEDKTQTQNLQLPAIDPLDQTAPLTGPADNSEFLNAAAPLSLDFKADDHALNPNLQTRDLFDSANQPRQDPSCKNPQGLSYSPKAKKREYGIGGRGDSTYEYLPKMFQLLGGLSLQYATMYDNSVKAMRQHLLFRPMIEDGKRSLLFPGTRELNLDPESDKKNRTRYEGTHLSCFAGGMFGLGSKMFKIEGDFNIAQRLTDGCVWAYDSMPSGIMPEIFEVVPCSSQTSCAWSETEWHNALDPDAEERQEAVDRYNKFEQDIYDRKLETPKASEDVTLTGQISDEKPAAAILKDGIRKEGTEPSLKKRDQLDEDEELPKVSAQSRGKLESSPATFKPKAAVSHAKWVQARIQEERLAPGYTKIVDRSYKLRPEAIESVFMMYRLTGDESWRAKGWTMFESIVNATTTDTANAAIKDVSSMITVSEDSMESFWLAETLKYFYLLFSEPDVVSLDNFVFNTEAHPFKVPK